MPCEHYQDALVDAAASGLEPQGELRAHLAACPACRATFAQEQSLFSSIDSGLSAAVNVEIPASLLPRVRASIAEESAPRRIWVSKWLVLASATVMFVAFLMARAAWRSNVIHQPVVTAVNATVPPHVAAPPQNHDSAVEPPLEKNGVPKNQVVTAKNHLAPESPARGKSTPEVLVPHDQEILLAEYAKQWSLHKHPLLLARQFDATILLSLQVSPIQIDELGVKLLRDEK